MSPTRRAAPTAATATVAALMGWCMALLAVAGPPVAAAAPAALLARPATPDDFLGLLLWAQAAAAARDDLPSDAAASVDAPDAVEARHLAAEWRLKHRALFRKNADGVAVPPKKAPPTVKKHAPPPKTTTTTLAPPPPPPTTVPAPALWAPEEAVSRAAVPALEEYDRSERFSHSFLHGFRPF